MATHTVIIQIKDIEGDKFESDVTFNGNTHILARAIASAMRYDQRIQAVFMEALLNLISGTDLKTEVRKEEV